jgi:eukaryotic-like serine/threonine-protein kinase
VDGFAFEPPQWAALRRLLDRALALPAGERLAWLATLHGDDAAFVPRLRSLLEAPALEPPGVSTVDFAPPPPVDAAPVGVYRRLRLLGEGGMASVWLAERTDVLQQRKVALKLPHGGLLQRGAFAERLAHEREILATLEHPSIARLYDAGVSAEGQPFLALEHVEGQTITAYCSERALDVPACLQLVLQVADAVAHAHARLVVHRDLKPSNILVTPDGRVKLLDFGIAKLVDDGGAASALTQACGHALTPDYASPEQIAGTPIGTASDVYSLGVVLFELLTGERPYRLRRGTRAALEEAIVEAAVPRPSSVAADARRRRVLRGDLDTIVLKALKKAPAERYASVTAFADDLRRFLQRRPVLAQPDGWAYRLRCFVGRNRFGVAAAALVCVAVLGGSAAAVWQAARATAEQRRAEAVKEVVTSIFREADPYSEGQSGSPMSARQLLLQADRRIAETVRRADLRVELRTLIGHALLDLDDTDGAEPVARAALRDAVEQLPSAHPQALRARFLMLAVHRFRGRGEQQALGLAELQRLLGPEPADAEHAIRLLEAEAHAAIDAGRGADALRAGSRALALGAPRWPADDARNVALAMLVALAHEYADSTPAAALAAADDALARARSRHRHNPRHPQLIDARQIHGRALARAGHIRRGVEELEAAAEDAIAFFGADSRTVGFLLGNLARYQRALGKVDVALANVERSLAIHERTAERGSFTVLGGLTAKGVILLAAGRHADARVALGASYEGLTRLFGPEHEETAIARLYRVLALAHTGALAEAEREAQAVLALYQSKYADAVFKPQRAWQALATVQRLNGDAEAAWQTQQRVLAMVQPADQRPADAMPALLELGWIELARGRAAAAQAAFEHAQALQDRLELVHGPARVEAALGRGRALLAQGAGA